jgi:hypothetical protein
VSCEAWWFPQYKRSDRIGEDETQNQVRFSVPFGFTSGNTVLPAGEYEVTQADRYVLRLRNVETQASGSSVFSQNR